MVNWMICPSEMQMKSPHITRATSNITVLKMHPTCEIDGPIAEPLTLGNDDNNSNDNIADDHFAQTYYASANGGMNNERGEMRERER